LTSHRKIKVIHEAAPEVDTCEELRGGASRSLRASEAEEKYGLCI